MAFALLTSSPTIANGKSFVVDALGILKANGFNVSNIPRYLIKKNLYFTYHVWPSQKASQQACTIDCNKITV